MSTSRRSLTHLLTLMFNLSNVALFFASSDKFPEHIGWLKQRLSESSTGYKTGFFIITPICLTFLAWSNQTTYSKTIDRALPGHPINDENPSENLRKRDISIAGFSASFKAIVSTASLLALLTNTLSSTAGWVIAGICLPGNLFSQFAIYAIPFVKKLKLHWSPGPRWFVANFLALSYNLPNVALYFNTVDEFLEYIDVTDHRLTEGNTPWEQGLLGVLIVFSAIMFISSQRTFSSKIADLVTIPEQVSPTEKACHTSCHHHCHWGTYIESRLTAFYRTLVTSLSLLAVVYALTDSLDTGIAIASSCFPGNLLAQFSVFKPSKQHEGYETINEPESEKARSRCFGLFGGGISEESSINLSEQQFNF